MTELALHQDRSLDSKIAWAKTIAPSGLLPKAYQKNPANLFLAAEYADALGIERINALTSIHVIEGKPTMSADLMAALARRAGHRVRVKTAPDGSAVRAELIRADDPDYTYEAVWTMKRAQAAGLASKGVWKAYPEAMLRNRAVSEVIRQGASEVLIGAIYTPEELGAEVTSTGEPVKSSPITEQAPVTVEELTAQFEPVEEANDGALFADTEGTSDGAA